MLTWDAPEREPLHYNLYVTDPAGCTTTVEIEPTETEYYDETTIIGTIVYRLTAVYEDCESEYALTPYGEDNVAIEVTGVNENAKDQIVTVVNVFNMQGQSLGIKDLNELNSGVYILQGLTRTGSLVTRKIAVNLKL